jgi:L-ascorbate 6-phosphate lactonase
MSAIIKPLASGRQLLGEIEAAVPRRNSVSIWWLGQSGYLIKSPTGLIVIDPYLSEHLTTKYADTNKPHVRMTAAPFRGAELTGVDAIVCSHKHSDHLDPGTVPGLVGSSPGARLVVPRALVAHAEGLVGDRLVVSPPTPALPLKGGGSRKDAPSHDRGEEPIKPSPLEGEGWVGGRPEDNSNQIIGIDVGETLTIAGFRIRAVASAHEGLDTDENGHHLYLGFVVEVEGLRLYHSGDSLAYEGLVEALGPEPFDVMFVPINGRDPKRGVAGNMSSGEAVDLASVVKPRYVVPHHYDMFTFNTVPVETFEAEARRLPVGVGPKVLRCGERWEVGPWV